jgi:small subunit ribosomal protein S3Ae
MVKKKKVKAKKWFRVISPKFFGRREIGRTLTTSPEALIGRRIGVSAIELTEDIKKYYLKFNFRIEGVKEDKAYTRFDSSECLRDYISRMVLKRRRKVDSIQDLRTKDGVRLRVKGIAMIPRRIKSSIEKRVRDRIKEIVQKEVESGSLDDFLKKLINDEIKNKVLVEVSKIYPVSKFEIRKVETL